MRSGARRLLICCAVCAIVLSSLYLGGEFLSRSILSEQRISDAVLQSLNSAFGDGIAVESISIESFRRVVLDGVRYSGTSEMPLDVDVDRVLVDLRLPIVDLILGRWTLTRCVSRIEFSHPVVAWNVAAAGVPVPGRSFDSLVDLILSNPTMTDLACDIEISDGQLELSGVLAQSEGVTFDRVSAIVSSEGKTGYSFSAGARWRETGDSLLSASGNVDAAARAYEIEAQASGVRAADTAPLLHTYMSRLADIDVVSGELEIGLSLERAGEASSWIADGLVKDVGLVHVATGVEVSRIGGSFSIMPKTAASEEPGEWFDEPAFGLMPTLEGPWLTGVLTTEGLQAEVAGPQGSSVITFGPGGVSLIARLPQNQEAVTAHGTVATRNLRAGGVEVADVACEFHYVDGSLELSEITGSLMGGELGGQMSLSLADDGLRGVGQGRVRGLIASSLPIDGISEALEARLDGTVSLTFSQRDGLGIAGQLRTLMPRVAGLAFDDGTLRFTCRNGLVSIDSLVLGLNGTQIVVKDGSSTGEEPDLALFGNAPADIQRIHAESS